MTMYRTRGHGSKSRVLVALVATFLFVSTLGGTAVAATGFDVTIPIDTVVRAPEDSVTQVATVDVAEDAAGQMCTVRSEGRNQHSVHPGNDFVVESGDSQVRLPDVESEPGGTVTADDRLTLGSTIIVSLDMGTDEVFSGGFDVVLDCDPIPGRIVVVKNVTEGSDTSQSFEFTASYDSEGFALSDGEQNDSGELPPGTYNVSESVPDGWTLESATCDDESPVDEIQLDADETVTCTFTNSEIPPEPGEIIVEKVVGGDSPTNVPFTFDTVGFDLADNTLAHGESSSSGDLEPGTYSVSEEVFPEWTLESATCNGEAYEPGSDIDLAAGETVTCTFVNTLETTVQASIVVNVSGSCEVNDDGDGQGIIDVDISVDDGAEVVVTDSDGDVIETLSSGATVTVSEDATYSWEATPNEGFEFPAGSETSGSFTIERCSDPETLPFTGPETEWMPALGIVLLAAGSVVLFAVRKREEF